MLIQDLKQNSITLIFSSNCYFPDETNIVQYASYRFTEQKQTNMTDCIFVINILLNGLATTIVN